MRTIHHFTFGVMISQVIAAPAIAQDAAISFGGIDWQPQAQSAELTTHAGKTALGVKKGRLWADDYPFSDGVISFKVAYPEHRAFIGAAFRASDRENYEEVYFRAHLNEKPDAIQYTPVHNSLSAWQIFSDANAVAPVSQNFTGWNDVKIVVQGDKADIYFNSDAPILHVPDLKTDNSTGGIVLRSSNRTDDTTYFADLDVRPLKAGESIVGSAKSIKALPENLIKEWTVSNAFDEALLQGQTGLPDSVATRWQNLTVETNGIANIARLHNPQEGADTVLIRKTVTVDEDEVGLLEFGFSDRVRLYLNGQLIFAGNDGYRSRDYRFLGTMGRYDAVGLALKSGQNEIVAAVSESFGGWGWSGSLTLGTQD